MKELHVYTEDIRSLDRIIRGIQRMKESGYLVERYDHHRQPDKSMKIIMRVVRTEESNDAEFEEWLYSAFKTPASSGQLSDQSKTPC